jgi:hypothetical protein
VERWAVEIGGRLAGTPSAGVARSLWRLARVRSSVLKPLPSGPRAKTGAAGSVWPGGPGQILCLAVLFKWAGLYSLFLYFEYFSKLPNIFKLVKYEKVTYRAPKISKIGMSVDKFKWDKFPCPNFQISLAFEL